MGNNLSSPAKSAVGDDSVHNDRNRFKSFPGSAILEKTFCGSIDTTDPAEYHDVGLTSRILKRAEVLCVSSPISSNHTGDNDDTDNNSLRSFLSQSELLSPTTRNTEVSTISCSRQINPSSAMFARALVSEVTDNPKTMKPAEMALREKKLLKAQEAATRTSHNQHNHNHNSGIPVSRPVGAPGGTGPPNILGSFAFACTGDDAAASVCMTDNVDERGQLSSSMHAPSVTQSILAGGSSVGIFPTNGTVAPSTSTRNQIASPHQVTIGLSLSRRIPEVGHPDTITRQTAFDFNELQDRKYKYVSSTDEFGWRAGGGEIGGRSMVRSNSDLSDGSGIPKPSVKPLSQQQPLDEKVASPDTCYLPIIQIDCPSAEAVDGVITALASGEIFIPHMSIIPEALSVSGGGSPPDLIVRFGCERNEDTTPDEWPNWCLEFMHNQLYEYFYNYGARWMKRPFSITIAKSIRWKTVKHMNHYFAHAERVIEKWREFGPQCLDPQLTYIDGGATPDEVAKPHGIYLFRTGSLSANGNTIVGAPTNYFSPNFEPPYTTKMTRSLLMALLSKSWDKKRREWTSDPIPRLIEPAMLMAAACGCTDPNAGGFLAKEVTSTSYSIPVNTSVGAAEMMSAISPGLGHDMSDSSPARSASGFQSTSYVDHGYHKPHSEVEFPVGNTHESDDDVANKSRGSRTSKTSSSDRSDFRENFVQKGNDDDNNSGMSEEKKSDGGMSRPVVSNLATVATVKKGKGSTSSRYNNNDASFSTDDEYQQSTTISGFDASVAASGSTVLRTNTTHVNHQADRVRGFENGTNPSDAHKSTTKSLYSDEDWDYNGATPKTALLTPTAVDDNDDDSNDPARKKRQPTNRNDVSSSAIFTVKHEESAGGIRDERFSKSTKDIAIIANFSSVSESTAAESDDDDSLLRLGNDHGALQGRAERNASHQEQRKNANENARYSNNLDRIAKDNQWSQLHNTQTRMDCARNTGHSGLAYTMPSNFKVHSLSGVTVEQTFSGTSLEYSTDGSSFLATDQASNFSLFGQNLLQQTEGGGPSSGSYDSDTRNGQNSRTKKEHGLDISNTNSSTDDNDSLLRDLAKGNSSHDSDSLHQKKAQQQHQQQGGSVKSISVHTESTQRNSKAPTKQTPSDTDGFTVMSIQESASYATSTTVTPSDEDLYRIGWAKALDPSSGNYYYFTLDRSKTVWDNPLAPTDGNSSTWGDGTASEVSASTFGQPTSPKRSPTKRRVNGRVDP